MESDKKTKKKKYPQKGEVKHKKQNEKPRKILTPTSRLTTLVLAVKNMFLPTQSSKPTLKQYLCTLESTDKNKYLFTRKYIREMTNNILGTWEPEHWFVQFLGTNITPSTGVLTSVNTITNQGMALWDEIEAIFDEFKFVGPFSVTYFPLSVGGPAVSVMWAIGVIDYIDATALSSVEGALAYDTHKCFPLNPSMVSHSDSVKWQGHFQGQPDLVWSGTTATVNVAFWKAYNFFNVTGSATQGVAQSRVLIKLRQMASV